MGWVLGWALSEFLLQKQGPGQGAREDWKLWTVSGGGEPSYREVSLVDS